MGRFFGEKPDSLGVIPAPVDEMMFYQYLPVKVPYQWAFGLPEKRLYPYEKLMTTCIADYMDKFGKQAYYESYVYLTCKNLYQNTGAPYNRDGWHSDGYMSDDINYIWSDKFPTIVNTSRFNLSPDHKLSIVEMTQQALPENSYSLQENELVRLDQYHIHKIAEVTKSGMRNFFKLSISTQPYNLKGNAINHRLGQLWEMKDRETERNHPTKHG